MEQSPSITPEDVAAELAANASLSRRFPEWAAQYQRLEYRHFDNMTFNGVEDVGQIPERAPHEAGETLCEPLPQNLRMKVSTLIRVEYTLLDSLDGEIDFWGAAWMGCNLAKTLLIFLLKKPFQRIAGALSQALAGSAEPLRQVMSASLASQPLTFSALKVVLEAFRSAQQQNLPEVGPVLAEFFKPDYTELIISGGAESCLEKLRRFKFLTEAEPPPMTRVDYLEVIKLLVGARSLSGWKRDGPKPNPPRFDVAILHHHLQLARLTVPEAS